MGFALLFAAHTTRAIWTTQFLMYFGLNPLEAAGISVLYNALALPLAVFYHARLFSEPHILHRLLLQVDKEGDHIKRLDESGTHRVAVGFLVWGASSGLALCCFIVLPKKGDFNLWLAMCLLLADLVLGRALEHKTQFFILYFDEVHRLLVESITDFFSSVEQIFIGADGYEPSEIVDQLHMAECKMRTHANWVNDVEGDALLGFLLQEVCNAVYTAGVAFFVSSPALTIILLVYSSSQLVTLCLICLDVAKPGDTFNKGLQNIDTPRMLHTLNRRLQANGADYGLGSDYVPHLIRNPVGIKIMKTLMTTPVILRLLFTVAVPTVAVAFQQSFSLSTKL
jgi:hypothetical protein